MSPELRVLLISEYDHLAFSEYVHQNLLQGSLFQPANDLSLAAVVLYNIS